MNQLMNNLIHSYPRCITLHLASTMQLVKNRTLTKKIGKHVARNAATDRSRRGRLQYSDGILRPMNGSLGSPEGRGLGTWKLHVRLRA